MHIHKLTASIVRLPLRRPLRRTAEQKPYSDNLLVRCELRGGRRRKPLVGWGEGVPLEPLTGETPEGALEQLAATPCGEQLAGDATHWNEVIALANRFAPAVPHDDPRGSGGNALKCAVELSLLDAFGKLFGEPASEAILHLPDATLLVHRRRRVQYSAYLDQSGSPELQGAALNRRLYGFKQCKMTVGRDQARDIERLETASRWLGPGVDLRLDAGGAWQAEELPDRLESLGCFSPSCLEQPLPHDQLAALAELRKQSEVPIMLDESLTSEADAHEAIRLGACDLFNIGLSKCGGLLASVKLAALAHRHGLGYQLGCHRGESGLLSAAGRHFATTLGGWWYLEGSYDRHLLRMRNPITRHDMTFRYGGWARAIVRPGLGTEIVPRRIRRRVRQTVEVLVDQ